MIRMIIMTIVKWESQVTRILHDGVSVVCPWAKELDYRNLQLRYKINNSNVSTEHVKYCANEGKDHSFNTFYETVPLKRVLIWPPFYDAVYNFNTTTPRFRFELNKM